MGIEGLTQKDNEWINEMLGNFGQELIPVMGENEEFDDSEIPKEFSDNKARRINLGKTFFGVFYQDKIFTVNDEELDESATQLIKYFKEWKSKGLVREEEVRIRISEKYPDFSLEDIHLAARISRRDFEHAAKHTDAMNMAAALAVKHNLSYYTNLSRISKRALDIYQDGNSPKGTVIPITKVEKSGSENIPLRVHKTRDLEMSPSGKDVVRLYMNFFIINDIMVNAPRDKKDCMQYIKKRFEEWKDEITGQLFNSGSPVDLQHADIISGITLLSMAEYAQVEINEIKNDMQGGLEDCDSSEEYAQDIQYWEQARDLLFEAGMS